MRDWHYTLQEVQIDPPATIFLYTDGLTEAEAEHHEQFGEERMLNIISTSHDKGDLENFSPRKLVEVMTTSVEQFVDGAPQHDDLTMLVISYTKHHRDMRLLRTITLPNDVQAVPQLSDFIDKVCIALDIDDYTATQINLAMEEAVVNVMKYAYPVGTLGDIDIEAQADDVRLRFTITDSGKPFDPTARKEVDTTLSAEERPIGGLGIHLVRQIMDSMNYERLGDKNVLTLRKKL
jgi:sigma-B regulation protein RsbU (phosphoserine phosphatase)